MKKTLFALAVLFTILLAAILFSRAISIPVGHDEYQFVASAQFFKESLLLPYVDYPFLHMPYMPIIGSLALLFTTYDLFAIRLLNSLFTLLTLLFLAYLVFHKTAAFKFWQRALFALIAALLYLANPAFIEIDGRALNHTLPILLSILTFWLVTRDVRCMHSGKPPVFNSPLVFSGPLFYSGMLSGLAAGIRLSYLVLFIPLLFAAFFHPLLKTFQQRLRGALSLLLGGALALLPAGLLFLGAPRPFIYGNFHYPILNAIYRQNLGSSDSITIPSKLAMFFQYVASDPATTVLYSAAFTFFILAAVMWIRTKRLAAFPGILLFVYSLVLLAAGFAPTPAWPQYFIALTPFLILGLFWSIASLKDRPARGRYAAGMYAAAWSLIAFLGLALLGGRSLRAVPAQLRQLAGQDRWVPLQLHTLAGEIQSLSGCQGSDCTLLTLVPIYPLEGGLRAYPMFAVGSFSWRTAPILPAETRAAYRIISPEELDAFLSSHPPAAVLTGTEDQYDGFTTADPGGLDQPFIDYARRGRYRPIPVNGVLNNQPIQLTLWVK